MDIFDNRMYLIVQDVKSNSTTTQDPNDDQREITTIKSTVGESVWRILKITSSHNGHTVAHELFHNLIHNHINAPLDLAHQIDPNNQAPGHKTAGGIFYPKNQTEGTKLRDINQKNIQDALKTLPETGRVDPDVYTPFLPFIT